MLTERTPHWHAIGCYWYISRIQASPFSSVLNIPRLSCWYPRSCSYILPVDSTRQCPILKNPIPLDTEWNPPLTRDPRNWNQLRALSVLGKNVMGTIQDTKGLGLAAPSWACKVQKTNPTGRTSYPTRIYWMWLWNIMKLWESMTIYDHLWPICFLINSKFWWLICCDCDPFLPRSSKGQLVASMNERCARTKQRFGHVLGLFLTHSKSLFGVVSSSLLLIPLPWPMIFHDHVWGFSFPQVAVVIPHRYFFDKNIFAASSGQVSSFPFTSTLIIPDVVASCIIFLGYANDVRRFYSCLIYGSFLKWGYH